MKAMLELKLLCLLQSYLLLCKYGRLVTVREHLFARAVFAEWKLVALSSDQHYLLFSPESSCNLALKRGNEMPDRDDEEFYRRLSIRARQSFNEQYRRAHGTLPPVTVASPENMKDFLDETRKGYALKASRMAKERRSRKRQGNEPQSG